MQLGLVKKIIGYENGPRIGDGFSFLGLTRGLRNPVRMIPRSPWQGRLAISASNSPNKCPYDTEKVNNPRLCECNSHQGALPLCRH